jgi:hypothetical protein
VGAGEAGPAAARAPRDRRTGGAYRTTAGAAEPAADARVDVFEYGLRRIWVTIAVILGALLEILDTTIVNVALPDIQGNVGASLDEGTFIVTGYIVANVVVIPLSPWLQQRFGRRQYFFASIVIFTIASNFCGVLLQRAVARCQRGQ